MLGSPLDLAWSSMLDSIYLKKAADWNAEQRAKKVRTLVNATKGDSDADIQKELDTILQDDYSRDLAGLNALRKALQEHHIDENGQLQTIDDPTDADSPDSVWDTKPYITEAVHHALNTHMNNVYNQASTIRDINAAMAARYISSIPDMRLRRNKVFKMMTLASEGRAWGNRTPTTEQLNKEKEYLQQMLDSGEKLPDDLADLPQLGPGHINRLAYERVKARNSLDLPQIHGYKKGSGSTFADPKEMTYTEITKKLREFQEVVAFSTTEDRVAEIIENVRRISPGVLKRVSPVDKIYKSGQEWKDAYEERIVKSRRYKDLFERKHRRFRADIRDALKENPDAMFGGNRRLDSYDSNEIADEIKGEVLETLWKDALFNAHIERERIGATQTRVYHQMLSQLTHEGIDLDTMDDDSVEMENHIDKILDHKQAQDAVMRIAHLTQVSGGAKGGYGGQDWLEEYHGQNMRQITNVWDNMSSEAQKILLGWCIASGPILGSLIKSGIRGRPDMFTKPLPKDAIEKLTEHIHSTSQQQKARGDTPATHQDDSRRAIADYLGAVNWNSTDSDRAGEARMLPIEAEEEEEFDPKTGAMKTKQGSLKNVPITDLTWANTEYRAPQGGETPTLDQLISKATTQHKSFAKPVTIIDKYGNKRTETPPLPTAKQYLIDTMYQLLNPEEREDYNIMSRSTESFDPTYWLENRVAPGMQANQALRALIYQGVMKDDPSMYKEYQRTKKLKKLLLDYNGNPRPIPDIINDKIFSQIYDEDTYSQLRRVGQGRKEKEQFLSTLTGKTQEKKACPHCNEHGHHPSNKTVNCLEAGPEPGQCYGHYVEPGQEHLRGYLRPMSTAHRDNASSRKFVQGLFGDLLGTIERNGERIPHMDWNQGAKKEPTYQMGLLAKGARMDREEAHRLNMTRVCPKCQGSGDVDVTGDGHFVTCSTCKNHGKRVNGLMRIPDMGAFYVSRGFGSPPGHRSSSKDVQEIHNLKMKIRERLYGRGESPVTQEQERAQESLERGMIPADGTTTPFEIHPLTRWPDLHTEKGPLSEEGLGKARADAVSALNKTPMDTMDDRKQFMKEYLIDYYNKIFARIGDVSDPTSAEIIKNSNPESITDSGFFKQLLELMSADLPYNTTNPLQLSTSAMNKVMSHMTHAHAPDFDGRNMHVDHGTMEDSPCTTCKGSGHILNGRGDPIISHFCPDCLGTKNEGVNKMLKRQPWIKHTYSREQLMDMFRTGKLDQELGRTPSYHSNKYLDSAGCSCETCQNGKSSFYHAASGMASHSSSGSMADKFRATMFKKLQAPMQLPVSIDTDKVTQNDRLYDEIKSALRRFRNIGDNPNQPFGTLEENQSVIDLETDQIEREIEKMYSMLSGKDARDALSSFHEEANIMPNFTDTWNSAPYLIPENAKPEDYTTEKIQDMPCPYCNRLKNLGLFKGEVKTIRQHVEEGGAGELAFTTCPEAEKRGDSNDGNLSKMAMDIKNNYFINNKPKDETQLNWEKAYETLSPTLQEMESNNRGRKGSLDPQGMKVKIMPGLELGIPRIAPVAPIMIAQHRAMSASGFNRMNNPNRRGRGRYSGLIWGVNTPTSQYNPLAMIGLAKQALPTNDNHKGEIMRLWALHILDPNYMVEKHGNPLQYRPVDIGSRDELDKVDEEQQKMIKWARGVLGKGEDEGLDYSERKELDHNWGKLQPLLHLEGMWKNDVCTPERKSAWRKMDLGLPNSMFNFDKPNGFMHDDDTFDNMLSLTKTWVHDRLASATEGGYTADDAGYKQPFENHPSMEWFYKRSHKNLNSKLLTAWKEHDEEALKAFGDEWLVAGKSLPEIEASGLMDKLWEGITNGLPVMTTRNGKRIEVEGWPSIEDVRGMNEVSAAKWYKLRKEMILRADNPKLSKERMDGEAREFAQNGANDLGTGTRCMVCLGNRTHMPGMNDAQLFWSAANPHTDGDVESHVPHVNDGSGGRRKLVMSGTEGMEGYTPKWSHPDSIQWIHEHMKTAHGHDGEEGWRAFFAEQQRHGIIPSEWEVLDENGIFSDNYVNWLVSQEPECVACKGSSHCHDCGGAGYSPVPFSEEAMEGQRKIHLLKRVIEHKGTGTMMDADGVLHPNAEEPMWRKPMADILADRMMNMPVGDRLSHLVDHVPQGEKLFTHEGNWVTGEDGEKKLIGSKKEYDSQNEYDTRQFILNRILEGENAYKKHLQERSKQIYPDGPIPSSWAWPSPEKPYTGSDAKLREWLEDESTTDDDKKKLFNLMDKYSKVESTGLNRNNISMGTLMPTEYSNLSIKQLQEKAKKLFTGKDFLISPGETVSGDDFLKPIMEPQAEVIGFNDWKLGELIDHDELKIKNYTLPGLIKQYEERTGNKLDEGGRFSAEDIMRLIYADKEQKDYGNDTWPSWWTPQHNESMHKEKFILGKDAFADGDSPRRCQHPSCGVGTEDGEPKLATYTRDNIGGKYNHYGDYCDDHHEQEQHSRMSKKTSSLGDKKVFGGREMLNDIINASSLDVEELEAAFRGEEMDPDRSTFTGLSQLTRLGLMFLGFHRIKGTNGNSDHFMPFFEGPKGRVGTAADFGLGHETSREGNLGIRATSLDDKEFWQAKDGRGKAFFDSHGWDHFNTANSLPMIRLSGINEKINSKGVEDPYRNQWSIPSQKSVCPECLAAIPKRVEDTESKEAKIYQDEHRDGQFPEIIPNCPSCGREHGFFEVNKQGKMKYNTDIPTADHVPMRSLLYESNHAGERIPTNHQVEKAARDRLIERMEAVQNGLPDPYIEGQDEPLSEWVKFSGRPIQMKPGDPNPENGTNVRPSVIISALEQLLAKRDSDGIILSGKDGKPKYETNDRKLIEKARTILNPNYRLPRLHTGFGSALGHHSNMNRDAFRGIHRVHSADKLVKNINIALLKKRSNVQKLSEKIDNAYRRLSKGKIQTDRDVGGQSEIGNSGLMQYVLSKEGRKVLANAKKIVKKSGLGDFQIMGDDKSTNELRDAQLIIRTHENIDKIRDAARAHQDISRLTIYSDSKSIVGNSTSQYFSKDETISAIKTANPEYATSVLNAMRQGEREMPVPMNDNIDEETRKQYESNGRLTHGIRPQSYHDIMEQHENTAKEEYNNWSRDYFYHGAANKAIDSDDESARATFNSRVPIPVQYIPGGNDAAAKSLAAYEPEENQDSEMPVEDS